MRKVFFAVAALCALCARADVGGYYNAWLGYLAGENAYGERVTYMGAGAGGGSAQIYRSTYMGAAAGVYSYDVYDTVAMGYRALRNTSSVSNSVAIGAHALEGMAMNSGTVDATWINGHFVANPPYYDADAAGWNQYTNTFYITADRSQVNGDAPIFWDGTNLHLRGFSPGSFNVDVKELMANEGIDYVDVTGVVWTVKLKVKKEECNSDLDPTQADVITYFTETTFGGVRAWTEAGGTGIFLYSGGILYYAADRGSLDENSPLSGADQISSFAVLTPGISFSMWTPNVTSFEYDGYQIKDTVVYRSELRQTLVEMGVQFAGGE